MSARRRKERCHDYGYQTQAMVIAEHIPFASECKIHPDLISTRVLLYLEDLVIILSIRIVVSLLL